MTTDYALFELAVPDYDEGLSLAERYAVWADANGHVIDAMESLAREWLDAGNRRLSMRALWERLRWESGIRSTTGPFKLNNDWPPFIARTLIARNPSWAEAISTRRAVADEVVA